MKRYITDGGRAHESDIGPWIKFADHANAVTSLTMQITQLEQTVRDQQARINTITQSQPSSN